MRTRINSGYSDKLSYDKRSDKGVMFFSASSVKDCRNLLKNGVYEILVSIFYLKKAKKFYESEFFPELKSHDGLFMIDSGGHTFLDMFYRGTATPDMFKEDFWIPMIEEYVEFLDSHSSVIYNAANFDMDFFVGRDIINKWNDKYFKPLEKKMNILYVIHESYNLADQDKDGYKQIEFYCKEHDYVGASGTRHFVENAKMLYQTAALYGTKIHGFGWTSLPTLRKYPFFSVDSTSWLMGIKYGTTYWYDGANFKTYDKHKKYIRNGKRLFCEDNNIDHTALVNEEDETVNSFNILAWKGARRNYLNYCTKLTTKPAGFYDKG